jgi:hypothetical protein
MRTSRGPRLALGLLTLLSLSLPARAQEPSEPSAALRLTFQNPWTTLDEPLIRISLRVRNDGTTTIADPAIVWTMGPRVVSRVQYETALAEGPSAAAAADTVFLTTDLEPGEFEDVLIRIDVTGLGAVDQTDSGVYPLGLELWSEDQPIAGVTTAAIHIVRPPQKRVRFSWWTEIATPVMFGPDGRLIDTGFERILAAGDGIAAQVRAIHDVVTADASAEAVDIVVSPAALEQLAQAADGYRRADGTPVAESDVVPTVASATLDRLRDIVAEPEVRMYAMPFAAPRLPALVAAGLRTHLQAQWRLGEQTVERILGETPDPAVVRPPGLAFDQASINLLATRGVTTLLGAADTVPRPPEENNYAPRPVWTIGTTDDTPMQLVLPDPGTQALLANADLLDDPVLAAQAALGELATIWKEQPVPPPGITRGLALDLLPDLPAGVWSPLVRRLSGAPFLDPTHAATLPFVVEPAPGPSSLAPRPAETFTTPYADDLAEVGRRLGAFAAMVVEPAGEADRLRRSMFYAEASQYIGSEGSGRTWISSVDQVLDRTFSRLAPDTSRVLTFTSPSARIPLSMGDPGNRVLDVRVELASGRVDFPDGNEQPVLLRRANQVVTFEAEVKAAGPSRIDVFVISPNGQIVSQRTLIVSSTALNPIALLITAGAGLVLVALWSRRFFRRRTR